MMILLHSALTN